MIHSPKTALGIDISNGRINLALLRKNIKGGIKLLKTASGPVPDGAIKNNSIVAPALLAGAIKKLKAKSRIYSRHSAMSLVANPTLVQILELPTNRPSNIRSFVHGEVKHYAVLPMGHAAVDFRGLKAPGRGGEHRVLVAGAIKRKLIETAHAFVKKGLGLEVIEPAWLAYIRACYTTTISQEYDANLLFAVAHGNTVTLSLFRNGNLDFVRAKQVSPESLSSGDYLRWLAEEINAVVRFYEFEVSGKSNAWKMTLAVDMCGETFKEKIEQLKCELDAVELKVMTFQDADIETPVRKAERSPEPSVVAVGLAMGLLGASSCDLGINLLPPRIAEARAIERQVLIGANIAAVIFVIIVLAVSFLDPRVRKVGARMLQQKRMLENSDTVALRDEQVSLQLECDVLAGKLAKLNAALATGSDVKWGEVLSDLGSATPQGVQILESSCQGRSALSLRGRALSSRNIQVFVEALSRCDSIESVSLMGTERETGSDGSVTYSIDCVLVQ